MFYFDCWVNDYDRSQKPWLIVPESNEALTQRLDGIKLGARAYAEHNAKYSGWDAVEQIIQAFLECGGTGDLAEVTPVAAHAIAAYGHDARLGAPKIAATFALEGLKALSKSDLYRAAYCAERGRYWLSEDMLLDDPSEPHKQRSQLGGFTKAARYEPVKNRLQKFLVELEPEEGWRNKSAAFKEVAETLRKRELSLVEGCGLKPENLERRFADWIRAEPNRFRIRLS